MKWLTAEDADLEAVDAVVIGGGDDIAPTLYGSDVVLTSRIDPDRDALERRIVEAALRIGIPMLGICRGAQMLNVASGGTLETDAYGRYAASRRYNTILPRKRVTIVHGSRLADIMGPGPVRVNALHKQAVDATGRDLRVVATDGAGMPQAIERVRDPFALGVQWHPEHILYSKRHRSLFSALVAAAEACRADRAQLDEVDRVLG